MTEEIAKWRWEKLSNLRVGLVRVRQLLNERHIDEVLDCLVAMLDPVGQRVEKVRKLVSAIVEEGLRPSLDIGHERVWKNLTIVVIKVLRELGSQAREPPHEGADEGDCERLPHGA